MKKNRKYYLIIFLTCTIILFCSFLIFRYYHNQSSSKNISASPKNVDNSNSAANDSQTIKAADKAQEITTPRPVPILMYHYVRDYNNPSDSIGTNLSVSPSVFDAQISGLKIAGFESISFDDYLFKSTLPAKPIIITFDDGYDDAAQAATIMKKYDFHATFYIITAKIGTSGYLDSDQILSMSKLEMKFGSHTVSHLDLSTASETSIKKQLSDSKKSLEDLLKTGINDFCFPSGKYTAQVIADLKNIGYRSAVTTKSPGQIGFTNYFELPRLRITNSDTAASLIKRVSGVK